MKKRTSLLLLIALILLLTACASASPQTPTVSQPQATTSPTETQAAPTNPPVLATPTTQPAAISPDNAPCADAAAFVTDVTVPDGTVMTPGQSFTKTWRLENSGSCAWTTFYMFGLEEGPHNAFWTDDLHLLTNRVEPGQQVDISVNLTAPTIPGEYIAYYQLRNAVGVSFLNFYIKINVQ